VGILSTVVITVIKPAELLKQSRDNRRIIDLKNIESAITLHIFNNSSSFYGTSSKVYVSVPDSSPNCANLSLPPLPESWSYICANESNYRKIDGSGWLPIDFSGAQTASFSTLPVDPINTNNSSNNYYSYSANGSYFHIYTPLESEKYSPLMAKDGGSYSDKYERGNLMNILPNVSGEGSAATGSIDSVYKYAWNENTGWLNFGTSEGNVVVSDTELTGYIWNENAGWISLNCSNTSSCGTVDYKVSNDGSGNLSGYAWNENTGWINFGTFASSTIINTSTGEFSGYAWGENIGWISLNCSNDNSCGTIDYKVKTSWRP
jgi:hypothetical protein